MTISTIEHGRLNIVSEIIAREFPGQDCSTPCYLGEGLVSYAYRVDVGGASFAVKLPLNDRQSLTEYELGEYQRECRWLIRAAEVGIPCARVQALGRIGHRPYAVLTFIAGVNGTQSSLDPFHIWQELGRLARLVHSIHIDDAEGKWQRYIANVIAGITPDDLKIALGIYSAEQQADILHIFEKLRTVNFAYGLNHCDLHPKNTLVDAAGTIYLMDWGSTSRDVNLTPHGELANLFWYHQPDEPEYRAFLDGYGISPSTMNALLPEVKALDLLLMLGFTGPPRSAYQHQVVARAKRLVAEDLSMLVEWARA